MKHSEFVHLHLHTEYSLLDGACRISEVGYKNLVQLVSSAHLDGFYYKPRIDKEILAKHSQGLIGLTSCLKGELPFQIKEGQLDQAKASLDDYRQIFAPGD